MREIHWRIKAINKRIGAEYEFKLKLAGYDVTDGENKKKEGVELSEDQRLALHEAMKRKLEKGKA